MLVQVILKSKASTGVVTVKPDAKRGGGGKSHGGQPFRDRGRFRPDGETPDGILSERDIVRELGKGGAGCLDKAGQQLYDPESWSPAPTSPMSARSCSR